MTFALAEIVGGDVTQAARTANRPAKPNPVTPTTPSETPAEAPTPDANLPKVAQAEAESANLARANLTRQAQATKAVSDLLAFYAENAQATQEQAAAAVGRSRQWVSATLAQLEANERVHRNGQITVLDIANS